MYVRAPLVGSASMPVVGTYSLETNCSGDGVENGVSVGEVGEPPCLNPFKVHGLKRESECRHVSFSLVFAVTWDSFTSISFVKRYMDMVVLL